MKKTTKKPIVKRKPKAKSKVNKKLGTIELTIYTNRLDILKISIFIKRIIAVEMCESCTLINCAECCFEVMETYDEVMALIKEAMTGAKK